jgi:hypothetical protein
MIDKLSLTIYRVPDYEYLNIHGDLSTDEHRRRLYRDIYKLGEAVLFCYPHKYSDPVNARIPYAKVDINPKHFTCYEHMEGYLFYLFGYDGVRSEEFNISRIDIAVDIENFPMDHILSILHVKGIRSESFNFYKGTIYAGSDPKVRIYDKKKEIIWQLKRGREITDYERSLLNSDCDWTRFEIQIRNVKKTLKDICDDPVGLVSYFDKLEIFGFHVDETSGVLQYLYRFINRKYRRELEDLKNTDLLDKIKNRYIEQVTDWFASKEPF